MLYELKNKNGSAKIDSMGAQLRSLKNAEGLEYMWKADPTYWGKSSPILFPIVCGLGVKGGKTEINGKDYAIPDHGFAKLTEFTVSNQTEDSIEFKMTDSKETLECYPFHFEFYVRFTLTENGLENQFRVVNTDKNELYFAVGGHPAFNCPLFEGERFEDYEIRFEKPETADCPVIGPDRLIRMHQTKRVLDNSDRFDLQYPLFAEDALIFFDLKSTKVRLAHKQTGRGVEVDFKGFPYLGIWTPSKIDSPFVCLEPWIGCSDRDDETGVFQKKHGVVTLPAGQEFSAAYQIILH